MKQQRILLTVVLLCLVQLSLCDEDYYKTLGISRNANHQQIKKAYRKLSQKYHPDLNRQKDASEIFQKINNAYEILSDKDKRRRYDQHGEEGLKQVEQQHDPFEDMFGMFGGGGQKRENKGPTLPLKVLVELKDIYNGKDVEVFMTKQTICPHCRASGADSHDDIKVCQQCNGKGMTIQKQYIGMGMYQQFQAQCPHCQGRGKVIKSVCHVCKGDKVIQGMDTVSVTVERGIKEGHKVVLSGSADEFHDKGASDLEVSFHSTPDPVFSRKGNDLHMGVRLSLVEALLGFSHQVVHLDGHVVVLDNQSVTQPGQVQRVKGEGMPMHNNLNTFGDLVVKYSVKFPSELTLKQQSLLQQFFKNS